MFRLRIRDLIWLFAASGCGNYEMLTPIDAYDVHTLYESAGVEMRGHYLKDGSVVYTGLMWQRGGASIAVDDGSRRIAFTKLTLEEAQSWIEEGKQISKVDSGVVVTGFATADFATADTSERYFVRVEFVDGAAELVFINACYPVTTTDISHYARVMFPNGDSLALPCTEEEAGKILGSPTSTTKHLRP